MSNPQPRASSDSTVTGNESIHPERVYSAEVVLAHRFAQQSLQLSLYALAVERVLFADREARPLGLAYWLVTDTGPKVVLPTRSPHAWFKSADFERSLFGVKSG